MDSIRMNEFDAGSVKPSKKRKGRKSLAGLGMRISRSRLFLTMKPANKGRKGNRELGTGKPSKKGKGRKSLGLASTGYGEYIGVDWGCHDCDLCIKATKEAVCYPPYWELLFDGEVDEETSEALRHMLAEALSDDFDYTVEDRSKGSIFTPNSDGKSEGQINDRDREKDSTDPVHCVF